MRSSTEQLTNIRVSKDLGYAKSEKGAVNPPAELTLPPQASADSLQDLIARMREAKKNRTRFHLTEADCNRMCTNGIDLNMANGQTIIAEGAPITSVYRIKKGTVSLVKAGTKLYDLSVGHFIGESVFIRGDAQDRFGAAMVANGPVVVTQLNTLFVRQLIEVDRLLAFKVYRHIAQKLSGLVMSVVGEVAGGDTTSSVGSPRGQLSNEMSMIRLDNETMTGVTGSEQNDVPFAVAPETLSARKARKSARKSTAKASFKKYPLEGDKDIVKLTDTRITISHDKTFQKKRKIKYTDILSISKTGSKTVTILHDLQSKILIFKNDADFHEFYGLVQFLVSNKKPNGGNGGGKEFSADVPSLFPDGPSGAMPKKKALADDEVADTKSEMLQLAVRQDLNKGDLVIAEGDLYQRIYTVVFGQFYMKKGGKTIAVLEEGDVFGVLTLFYMRPSQFSLEVASENATVLVIPGYKIHELVNTNFALAVRIFKKAAQQIYTQIEKLLTSNQGIAKGLTETHFLL